MKQMIDPIVPQPVIAPVKIIADYADFEDDNLTPFQEGKYLAYLSAEPNAHDEFKFKVGINKQYADFAYNTGINIKKITFFSSWDSSIRNTIELGPDGAITIDGVALGDKLNTVEWYGNHVYVYMYELPSTNAIIKLAENKNLNESNLFCYIEFDISCHMEI